MEGRVTEKSTPSDTGEPPTPLCQVNDVSVFPPPFHRCVVHRIQRREWGDDTKTG